MSHFFVSVIVPADTDSIEETVCELLAPYSEDLEVPEYNKTCYCVGSKARRDANNAIEEQFGPIAPVREAYWKLPDSERPEGKWEEMAQSRQRELAEKEFISKHPLRNTPESDCDDCGGTGSYLSERNPEGYWDWYSIGGRWTGVWDKGYDPTHDPENQKVCDLCNGTGKRQDVVRALSGGPMPAFATGDSIVNPGQKQWDQEALQEYLDTTGCNGCDGNGMAAEWPTKWKRHETDIVVISSILPQLLDGLQLPYSIVTPDGKWHSKGTMGWWGVSRDEQDDWHDTARKIFETNKDCIAVVVDCHI